MGKGKRRLKFRIDFRFYLRMEVLGFFFLTTRPPCLFLPFSLAVKAGIIIPYVALDPLGSAQFSNHSSLWKNSHCGLQPNRTLRWRQLSLIRHVSRLFVCLFVCVSLVYFYLAVFHTGCSKDAIERKEKLFWDSSTLRMILTFRLCYSRSPQKKTPDWIHQDFFALC